MDRRVWIVAALAAVGVSGLSASDQEKITVTGCLQNFSAKGTVGTTEKGYLLTTTGRPDDALALAPVPTPGTTAAGTPTGTSGTAGPGMPTSGTWAASGAGAPPPASKAGNSYLLDGPEKDLKAQVGHKVEVTGTLEPRDADSPPKTSEDAHLQVASIRMLASNCSQRSK